MSRLILVSGDCVCDHNVYKGNRLTVDAPLELRGVLAEETCGGAAQLSALIAATMKYKPRWNIEFTCGPTSRKLPSHYHAFCLWEPQVANPGDTKKKSEVWRATEPPLGYGQHHRGAPSNTCHSACPSKPASGTPDIFVIDDAGLDFRKLTSKAQWPFSRDAKSKLDGARWIVVKMAGEIGTGDLWSKVIAPRKERLVLVVSAEQLRSANVRISRGLSWEATIEDLLAELQANPALSVLRGVRHLIVTFRSDAACWVETTTNKDTASPEKETKRAMLVFDAVHAEGEWSASQGKGTTFGYMSCFVAAVVRELCCTKRRGAPDLESALLTGLGASRELRRIGHGLVTIPNPKDASQEIDNPAPGFPYESIAKTICQPPNPAKPEFVSAWVPYPVHERGDWTMLDEWLVMARQGATVRPHYEIAQAVAVVGSEALATLPVAQFGSYQTVDRKEIESLRTIRQLILNYTKVEKRRTPLNLGVFGPPGSGKSYIVIEIAKEVLKLKKEDVLLFNLSQFSDPADLVGAFHQIRDRALSGATPFVFWDEFDSQGYKWLQYLLAPMEDGEFQDGQITHPIGRCIFFFAGATSPTYAEFGPLTPDALSKPASSSGETPAARQEEVEKLWNEFVLKKGPDFRSRLSGYLDILGVNRKLSCEVVAGRRVWTEDESDLCFPIRRALFMRSLLRGEGNEALKPHMGVVRAMLEIPKYKGGGRSLQTLCAHLKSTSKAPGRSDLPSSLLLDMHVNADEFWTLCEQDMAFSAKASVLAHQLHEAYRLRIKGRPDKKDWDVPFEDLSQDMKSANMGQAMRIPGILRLANLRLEKCPVVALRKLPGRRSASDHAVEQILNDTSTLDRLAEAEHNGWMVERMLSGWRYGRHRDNDARRHPSLIPYRQLSDYTKGFDRLTITGCPAPAGKPRERQFGYLDLVKLVGLRIVKDDSVSPSVTTTTSATPSAPVPTSQEP